MTNKFYNTVTYKCPRCGDEASSTAPDSINDAWLKAIEGSFCPGCEKNALFIDHACKFMGCFHRKGCIATGHTCAGIAHIPTKEN